MRVGRQKQGYTIVEVMIFLAISGFMFVTAAAFVNGKQARSQFRQGMNDLNSQVQQVINDVSNGFYPSHDGFGCTVSATGGPPSPGAGSGDEIGTNKGCTFNGKVMQFGVLGKHSDSTYNVYTVVGRQFKANTDVDGSFIPPASLSDAQPVVATAFTQTNNLKWGIQLDKMTDHGSPIGAFGIFAGFSTTSTKDNLDSGAATPIAFSIPGSALGQSTTDLANEVKDLAAHPPNTDPDIVMCFTGGANQHGRLTIGSSNGVKGQRLSTSVQITSGTPPAGCEDD